MSGSVYVWSARGLVVAYAGFLGSADNDRANLSTDYFTNRQDRYHLFSSAEVSDYFHRIHRAVASLSYLVTPSAAPQGFALTWPSASPSPSTPPQSSSSTPRRSSTPSSSRARSLVPK